MNLSYEKEGDKYNPIFKGDSFEEKLLQYDSIEDEETKYEFLLSVIRRITYLITLWFLGRAESQQDFELFDKNFLSENTLEEEPVKEESVTEPPIKSDPVTEQPSSSSTNPTPSSNIIEEIKP